MNTRRELIGRHLGVQQPYQPVLEAAIEEIQGSLYDLQQSGASPEELTRLYSQLIGQLSGEIARLHGGR